MINLLIRLFVKDADNVRSDAVRRRHGHLAGVVGIVTNLLLFGAKLVVGTLAGSIAITADAMNNLSDCASSMVTLIGFKLSGIPADEHHPYGHARFEYISGLVVSFFILIIGLELLRSSFAKALHPQAMEFSAVVAAVLALSIMVKLWQCIFYRRLGRRIDSGALGAASSDSLNDVLATGAVLAAAAVTHFTGWHWLDGVMGILVAVFILISGVKLVRETLDPLLGTAPDAAMVGEIQQRLLEYPTIIGTHDLMIHNYGPGRCFASVHAEVPASQDILVSHDIIDNIERDFQRQLGIHLVVHLDPLVTDDERISALAEYMADAARGVDPVLTIHDFRMVEGSTHTNLIFDVLVPPRFSLSDSELRRRLEEGARQLAPNYYCVIRVDRSYTSTTN